MNDKSIKAVGALVLENREKFERVLPPTMSVDKFMTMAGALIRDHPEWEKIDGPSLIGSLLHCAYLGFEPGALNNLIYLIPYQERSKGELVRTVIKPMLSYFGMIELMGTNIRKIMADTVYYHDQFRVWNDLEGDCQHMTHEKNVDVYRSGESKDIRGAYAIIVSKDGTRSMEYLSKEEIERDHRKDRNPVWSKHFTEMCKKTAIRRIYKTQLKTVRVIEALAREDDEDFDYSKLTHEVIGEGMKPVKPKVRDLIEVEAIEV